LTQKHFLALDGLRGVAAVAIVMYHRRWWLTELPLDHAYLAVDFFFLLSGFVIAHAYEGQLASSMSFAEFVRIRLIRLGPMLIFGGLIGGAFVLAKAAVQGLPIDSAAVIAMVDTLFALPTPFPTWMDPGSPFPINAPTWSLFFEIASNLAFALLAPLLRTRVLVAVVVVSFAWLVAVVLSTSTVAFLGFTYPTFLGGVPRTVFSFFAGVLVYRLHLAGRLPLRGAGLAVLALALLATFTPPAALPLNAAYELLCIAVVFPALVAAGAYSTLSARSERFAKLSGAISYPAYITHYPLLFWLNPVARLVAGLPLLLAVTTLVVGFSYAALKLVDEPMRRWLTVRFAGIRQPPRSQASINP
jgi:peptidoglycan/LPS O-acetylase OafA/YrhL